MNTKQIIEMIDLFYALKRMYKRLKKTRTWSADCNLIKGHYHELIEG